MHIVKWGALCSIFMRPANLDIMSVYSTVVGDILRGEQRIFLVVRPAHSLPDGRRFSAVNIAPAASMASLSITAPSITRAAIPTKL